MQRIRPAAVAGSFYPAKPEDLRQSLHQCFLAHPLGPQGKKLPSSSLLGGMVPHAGYVYSGPCAAHLYSNIDPGTQCVILLGVNHRGRGARAALSAVDCWETPLGRTKVDRELVKLLKSQSDLLADDEQPHRREHSIEVQLPFLQSLLGDFSLLPLSLSHLTEEECGRLGEVIARLYEATAAMARKTVIIASSDLSHYLPPEETERLDDLALEPILALDPSALLKTVKEEKINMCGVFPTAVFLFAARALGAKRVRLLKHCHSGDAMPMKEVVGYASVAVEF